MMSSILERLGDMKRPKTQYVRQTSYDVSDGGIRTRENTRSSFTQVDFGVLLQMSKDLSPVGLEVALFILSEIDYRTNCVDYSAKQIAQQIGISVKSVERGMTELKLVDFMRKVQRSQWMVNPTVAIRCGRSFLTKLMDTYCNLDYRPPKSKEKDGVQENAT